jgi:hypothetical protein
MKTKPFRTPSLLFVLSLALLSPAARAEIRTRDYAVKIWASVAINGQSLNGISLQWHAEPDAITYDIYRKHKADAAFNLLFPNLTASTTSKTDTSVTAGQEYEYLIVKNTSDPVYKGYGYTYTGVNYAAVHNRGKILLVYTPAGTPPLSYKQALVSDGWTVLTLSVSQTATPESVRTSIRNQWLNDPTNLKTVLLLGHVPVKYSGAWVPGTTYPPDYHDGHGGAWPADAYYGFMTQSAWLLNSATVTGNLANADGTRNANNGSSDNKFDEMSIPGDMDLAVGRVDFKYLGGGSYPVLKTEAYLMANYFSKNINYRAGAFRGVISQTSAAIADFWDDQNHAFQPGNGNLVDWKALSATAWAFFANFTGGSPDTTDTPGGISVIPAYGAGNTRKYFLQTSDVANPGYLWSAATGDGQFSTLGDADGTFYIGTTADWDAYDVRSVFVLVGGSYFGD